MARTFSREEFYELVWTKPMTHLAKEFAISDVALHKICKKHGIPNPPPGWWAKQASGKKVRREPLPLAEREHGQITITDGNLGRETEALASVREQARVRASYDDDAEAPAPHPIIERTLKALKKSKPSDKGLVFSAGEGVIKCDVAPSSIERLALALPRIVRAVSLQGFSLIGGREGALFASEGERLSFSIVETVKREKHILTEAERVKQEAWRRKQQRARGDSWSGWFDRPIFPEWDFHPTGILSLEFEHVYVFQGYAPRRTFRDAKIQRLENMASDIAVAVAVLAAAKTEERVRREEAQRHIEDERRRREMIARAKHIEERRSVELGQILGEMDELDRLRRLIATLPDASETSPRFSAFMGWLKQRLDNRADSFLIETLEKRFDDGRLFGEDDDHGFSPSRW